MRRGNKNGLSDRKTGYLLVLPALLLILVIAIYPVARSFFISMYDIRLNDPTKQEAYSSYGINLELYAQNAPLLASAFEEEIGKAKGTTQEELTHLRDQVQEVTAALESDPDLKKNYDQVDEILLEGEAIPEAIKIVDVDEEKARSASEKLVKVKNRLTNLDKAGKLAHPKKVIGLTRGTLDSFIEPNFIGLKYYTQYFNDNRMWSSLNNTFIFTFVSVTLELIFGLWIAMVINREFFGRGAVRAAVLIPWALPTAVAALMWKFLFDGQNGILAMIFEKVGLISNMGTLLTTPFWSMFAVIFADVWKTTPFMALLILAGLQTIPQSLYEAAEVDGAGKVQQFIKITLPMLRTTILVALLFRTLDAFRVFDLIFVLTGGGPANATESISMYAYKVMFAQMNFGAGSALSVIVFLCVAAISILFVKLLGRDLISDKN
ncbi:ABC transporter permease subunit [Salinithrix halophila]|uniref:ABC transporter permease subunit n=1 Tax=Salinithrix halophila TaxID=1485204 RepID=A0ABV8JDI2_9BACL